VDDDGDEALLGRGGRAGAEDVEEEEGRGGHLLGG